MIVTTRTTLAGLVLGLFALPLVPTAALGQAPQEKPKPLVIEFKDLQFQLENAQDGNKGVAELEKAKAQLAKLQEDIRTTQARIKEIEARFAAAKGGKPGEPAKQGGIVWMMEDPKKAGVNEIVLRKVGDHWEVVQPARAKQPEKMELQFQLKGSDFHIVPADPKQVPPPAKRPPVDGPVYKWQVVPEQPNKRTAPENRIDALEHQLQQILKELESLRKDSKPQNGIGRPGFGPSPTMFGN